jgi:Acetyltransferases
MQADWRVFTPRPGFYDEVGTKYNEALADPDTVVLVAEDEDGEVVGMAYGEARTPSRFSDERALELSGVVVRAGYRGRGVGRELVHEAARFAADRGVRWVELKTFAPNRGAMEFWEDLGFTARVVQLTSPTKGPVGASRGALTGTELVAIGGARERTGPPIGSNERSKPRETRGEFEPRRGEDRCPTRHTAEPASASSLGQTVRTPEVGSAQPRGAARSCPSTTDGICAGSTSPSMRTSLAASAGAARRWRPRKPPYAPSPRKPSRRCGGASGLGTTSHQAPRRRSRQSLQNRSLTGSSGPHAIRRGHPRDA